MRKANLDTLNDAAKFMVACYTLGTTPTFGSITSVYDAFKTLKGDTRHALDKLADEITTSAHKTLNAMAHDIDGDAEVLYVQMVEASALTKEEIVAANLDADEAVTAMIAKLDHRDHTPHHGLFRMVTEPLLLRVLEQRDVIDELNPAIMAALLARLDRLERKVDMLIERENIDGPRAVLHKIATRFDADNPDATDAELALFLVDKADELRALRDRLDKYETAFKPEDAATAKRVSNLFSAAKAALDEGKFEETRARIEDARAVQREAVTLPALRREAELSQIEAESFLLEQNPQAAAEVWKVAAATFVPLDKTEAGKCYYDAANKLIKHNENFGGEGLSFALELLALAQTCWTRNDDPERWGWAENTRGVALENLGDGIGGRDGAALILKAIRSFRSALQVRTLDRFPHDHAMTQDNLATALRKVASFSTSERAAVLLKKSVSAHQTAAEIFERLGDRTSFATSTMNLGNTYATLDSVLQSGPNREYLSLAIDCLRQSLQILGPRINSIQAAMAMYNLGNALCLRSAVIDNDQSKADLDSALASYDLVLTFFSVEHYPVQWAMAQEALGQTYISMTRFEPTETKVHLKTAVQAFDKAIDVYGRLKLPDYLRSCQDARTRIAPLLAAL